MLPFNNKPQPFCLNHFVSARCTIVTPSSSTADWRLKAVQENTSLPHARVNKTPSARPPSRLFIFPRILLSKRKKQIKRIKKCVLLEAIGFRQMKVYNQYTFASDIDLECYYRFNLTRYQYWGTGPHYFCLFQCPRDLKKLIKNSNHI